MTELMGKKRNHFRKCLPNICDVTCPTAQLFSLVHINTYIYVFVAHIMKPCKDILQKYYETDQSVILGHKLT